MRRKRLPKDRFFESMDSQGLALTFDDVRLRTGHSRVMPDNVNLETSFSRHIPLGIPAASAAMDTVTESPMAIAIAELGGIGVIHKSLEPEEQARQVAKVKHHLNGLIRTPIYVHPNDKIEEILKRITEKGYNFHSFPVVDGEGKLVGILTEDDFEFCSNVSLMAGQVMSVQLLTAKAGTSIREAYDLLRKERKRALPLVDGKGHLAGLYVWSDVKRILSGDSKLYNVDKNGQLRVAAAIGVYDDAFARLEKLIEENVDVVVIDSAHGDSEPVIETLKRIKKEYDIDVVAGNVSETESVRKLIRAGADGIKVGQGGGSICTTRVIAGIGTPQVTAIYECSKEADKSDIPVCGDGGLMFSGDITIAIGAGAKNVMMGNMLAGTEETPGNLVFRDGRTWKEYRGMGSEGAMEVSKSARERYFQAGKSPLVPEGIEGLVPYRGKLSDVMIQYMGGLRRGMGYIGAANIEELRKKARFRGLTRAGAAESHPHGVMITREAPNYPGRYKK
jgi:IMP dehydrogenase